MPAPTPPRDVSDVIALHGPGRFSADVAAADANGVVAGPPPLPLVRVRDLVDPGPTKWIVEQLWTEAAFGIVGAEPKSWKSWLTLYLGICVASGTRAFNRFEVQQGPVAVFSAEGGQGLLRQRAELLCNAMKQPIPDDLFAIDVPVLRLDDPTTSARILSTVQGQGVRLLILDPLRELHGGDENDAADIARLLEPLRGLQREGCACMLVHHLGKRSEGRSSRAPQRGGQRLRGSSALHGAVDSALYLETEGEGEKKRVTVQAEHRAAVEPAPFTLRLRHSKLEETVLLEIVDREVEEKEKTDRATVEQQQKRQQIIRAVSASCKPGRTPHMSASSIYQIVKGTKTIVLGLVKTMVEEGDLAYSRDKGYSVPQEDA